MRIAWRGWLAAALVLSAMPAAADEAAAWAALRAGGHVALMRHASTEPGLGDPPGYKLDDCATQRNLSAQGREEARRIGERLRKEGVVVEKVYTSPWCRCRDTALEAFGKADDWEALSSFFDDRSRARARAPRPHRAGEEPHRHLFHAQAEGDGGDGDAQRQHRGPRRMSPPARAKSSSCGLTAAAG